MFEQLAVNENLERDAQHLAEAHEHLDSQGFGAVARGLEPVHETHRHVSSPFKICLAQALRLPKHTNATSDRFRESALGPTSLAPGAPVTLFRHPSHHRHCLLTGQAERLFSL
jgi:hypothetical protein